MVPVVLKDHHITGEHSLYDLFWGRPKEVMIWFSDSMHMFAFYDRSLCFAEESTIKTR